MFLSSGEAVKKKNLQKERVRTKKKQTNIKQNRIREMIRFELGKETENVFFVSFRLTDPSSIQDPCHMNFVTFVDLTHRRVSVAQW